MCLGVPGRILEVRNAADGAFTRGTVDLGGIRRDVSLAFTPDARVGEWVLVHVGFALVKLDEREAARALGYLEEIGRLEEEAGVGS